jgi:imidazolonepropionase-like amidohydrolase
MFAVRNGLSPEAALRAITATPAELLGLSEQIGIIAPGAAADLVAWSAEPFDATSRPLLVMIDGRVVYED